MRGATTSDKRDYLRADLIHQLAAPQLEKFLNGVQTAVLRHASARVLIYVHVPQASYKIEKYHGSRFIDLLAATPRLRVALVATHREVQLVHQYIEALARLKKANLRSFADEATALAWLLPPALGLKAFRQRTKPRR